MTPRPFSTAGALALAAALSLAACAARPADRPTTRERLLSDIEGIRKIDTHEHLMPDQGFFIYSLGDYRQVQTNFYHIVARGYLGADLTSAGAPWQWDVARMNAGNLDELWALYGRYLASTRNTSYYLQLHEGFRALYGLEGVYFTQENVRDLSARITANYQDFPRWFDAAFRKANFEVMFLDQWWSQLNTAIDTAHFALVFRVDNLVDFAPLRSRLQGQTGGDALNDPFALARSWHMPVATLAQYLAVCDRAFRVNVEHKAVAVKIGPAYARPLDIDPVPEAEAAATYLKRTEDMSPQEFKRLQDFMFNWVASTAAANDLPVQVHTGYLASNYRMEDNANPARLNAFFLRHKETRFVTFHGGFPWTGTVAALAKNLPNVAIDMVWLAQISRETAVQALQQWLDCVPYTKLFVGYDGHHIEESVGAMKVVEGVVAEVLADRVDRGRMTLEAAQEIARAIFRENAIRYFKLEEKLGRPL